MIGVDAMCLCVGDVKVQRTCEIVAQFALGFMS